MSETTHDDMAITLKDVWVQYRLRNAHQYNLKRSLSNAISRRREETEIITALQGISLEIPKGARIGLFGPNGSGKSTLLSVMAGVLKPTMGTARTTGRVLALLGGPNEGLDPEQTGRENAINLAIRLGDSSDSIESRIEGIHDFSGLGSRFDHPVYTYSSGMQVRLRFSTITSISAEVLLIDEGIGAADAEFNVRAESRMKDFLGRSGTLVLSSHSNNLLDSYCDSFLSLDTGSAA